MASAGLPRIARIIGEGIARQVIDEITGGKRSGKRSFDDGDQERSPELLTDVPGIGKKMAEKLQSAGIITVSDLLKADDTLLSDILGSARARKVLAFLSESEKKNSGSQNTEEIPETQKVRGQSSWEDFGC